MNRYAHYTYTVTNKASLIVLGIVVVVSGSLLINALAPTPELAEVLLKRIAWPLWGLAFVIRAGQWWIFGYLR
jgi:hypothetical protein